MREYQPVRLKMYQKRKDFLEGQLEAEASRLSNQARFILEKCSGELVVENKKRKTIVDELLKKGYDPDPVKTWKDRIQIDEAQGGEDTQEEEEEEEGAAVKKKPAENSGMWQIFFL